MDWYPDPADARLERYWDGTQWTRNTRLPPGEVPSAPIPQAQRQPVTDFRPRPGVPDPRAIPGPMPYRTQAGFAPGPGRMTADGVRLAGWWSRLAALILDYLLITIVQTIALMLFGQRILTAMRAWESDVLAAINSGSADIPLTPADPRYGITTWWYVYNVALLLAQFLYATLMMHYKGATVGQLMMGLRVVHSGQGRARFGLGWSTSIVRNAGWLFCQAFSIIPRLSTFGVVLTLANGLWPLFNPNRQALHDLLARTQVISVRP